MGVRTVENTLPTIDKLFHWALESYSLNMIVDENGIIRHMGRRHALLYGGEPEDFVGRPVLDVIPNSKVMRVLATGKEESGFLFTIRPGTEHSKTLVCSRIPICDETGRTRGVLTLALFNTLEIVSRLQKEIEDLHKANDLYRSQLDGLFKSKTPPDGIAGHSLAILELKDTLTRVAPSELPVLLTGETGVGKEVFANAIHRLSKRKEYDFVKINCAAIPKDLIESELFGYEPGAFSGALRTGKKGKFEQANHGTILLDEVGELPLAMQSKLLRVLQEYELERIGGTKVIHLDTRIIAATNQNLRQLVREGKFRGDLYYRLNVVEMEIPPLREHMEDLDPLCNSILKKIERQYKLVPHTISPRAMDILYSHSWPGNIRELEHCLSRACVMADSPALTEEDFKFLKIQAVEDPFAQQTPCLDRKKANLPDRLHAVRARAEREQLIQALENTGGNKAKAAKLLGISRSCFYTKLKKHKIGLSSETS